VKSAAKKTESPSAEQDEGSKDSAGGLAIGAEINCCFDSDTEIGLMKQK